MHHKITLFPGDGIGPEVAEATCRILAAAGATIEWETVSARTEGTKRVGEFPLAEGVASVRRNRVASRLANPLITLSPTGCP